MYECGNQGTESLSRRKLPNAGHLAEHLRAWQACLHGSAMQGLHHVRLPETARALAAGRHVHGCNSRLLAERWTPCVAADGNCGRLASWEPVKGSVAVSLCSRAAARCPRTMWAKGSEGTTSIRGRNVLPSFSSLPSNRVCCCCRREKGSGERFMPNCFAGSLKQCTLVLNGRNSLKQVFVVGLHR